MSLEDRTCFACDFFGEMCIPLLEAMGQDNPQEANALFRRLAHQLSMSHYKVWLLYFLRQVDGIIRFVRDGDGEVAVAQRIAEAINYLLILASMIEEDSAEGLCRRASTSTSNERG